MLRARLATSLLFNVLLAVWVLHDARTRRGRKPLFASVLTLLWGPLGLGLWASDRPLARGEARQGTAATMARTFLIAWTVAAPATFVLLLPEMLDRSAVPGAFARRVGVTPAAVIVTVAIWVGPAGIAALFGSRDRSRTTNEVGRTETVAARPSLEWACVAAGVLALACAWWLTR